MHYIKILVVCVSLSLIMGQQDDSLFQASDTASYKIVGKYRRSGDMKFFTEGLSFVGDNVLLESSGLYGDSEIHYIKDFQKGSDSTLSNRHQFEKKFFGEGSSRIKSKDGKYKVYMMTYQERKVFVLDDSLENVVQEYDMPKDIKEGWGMTHYEKDDQVTLLISDGTNRLFHVDPEGFIIKKTITVQDFNGNKLDQINELEYYKGGSVLANIWNTNYIVKINPEDGQLLNVYNFQGIVEDLESEQQYANYVDPFSGSVLNGIAYEKTSDKLILGGKQWPYWYEIQLNE